MSAVSAVNNIKIVDLSACYRRETHQYVSVGFAVLQKDAPAQFVFAVVLWV